MLTPNQQEFLDRLRKSHPQLFSKFDLTPIESPEYLLNSRIETRVTELLHSIESTPLPPAFITKPRKPWDPPEQFRPGEIPF